MSGESEIPELPQEIAKASEEGRLVLFIGAGLSCAAGLIGWGKLKDELIQALKPNGRDDLEDVKKGLLGESNFYNCFGVVHQRDADTYNAVMKKSLTPDEDTSAKFKRLIGHLSKLNPVSIVTLNVDPLLVDNNPLGGERSIRSMGDCWPWEICERKIFFFHGKADNRGGSSAGWVFNYEELKKRYDKMEDCDRFLYGLFSGRYVILFVGFSFSDELLLKRAELPEVTIKEIESGERAHFHYALIASDASTVRTRLRAFGVKPLQYRIAETETDPIKMHINFEKTLAAWGAALEPAKNRIEASSEAIPMEGPAANA